MKKQHKKVVSNKRILPSHILGDRGEIFFDLYCNEVELNANKAGRDRSGWDYDVTFPFPPPKHSVPLDQRPGPIQCKVQVKAVWAGAKEIELRLSSAECLAKARMPTFVFVIEINRETLAVESLYGIHVDGQFLEFILKSIRRQETLGSLNINRKFIHPSYKKFGNKLHASGEGVKDFILSACGDLAEYVNEKLRKIDCLGATEARFTGTFTIKNESEIIDILLGTKAAELASLVVHETKWDLPLPVIDGIQDGKLWIIPSQREGSITFRGASFADVAAFNAKIIMARVAGEADVQMKLRIVNPGFELLVDLGGGGGKFTSNQTSANEFSVDWHIRLVKTQRILASSFGTVEVKLHGRAGVVSFRMNHDPDDVMAARFSSAEELLVILQDLISAAGDGDLRFTIADVNRNLGAIHFANAILKNPRTTHGLRAQSNAVATECLILDKFKLGDASVAYCAIGMAELSPDGKQLLSLDWRNMRQLEIVGNGSFLEFEARMRSQTGVACAVWVRPHATDGSGQTTD